MPDKNYWDVHKITKQEVNLVDKLLKKLVDYQIFERVKRSDGQTGHQITKQFDSFMVDYILTNGEKIDRAMQQEKEKKGKDSGLDEYGQNMVYFTIMEYISMTKQIKEAIKKNPDNNKESEFNLDYNEMSRWQDNMTEEEEAEIYDMATLIYGNKQMAHQREVDKTILSKMVDLGLIKKNSMLTEEFKEALDKCCKDNGINIEELKTDAGHEKSRNIMLAHIDMEPNYFNALPVNELMEYHDMARAVQRSLVFEEKRK